MLVLFVLLTFNYCNYVISIYVVENIFKSIKCNIIKRYIDKHTLLFFNNDNSEYNYNFCCNKNYSLYHLERYINDVHTNGYLSVTQHFAC